MKGFGLRDWRLRWPYRWRPAPPARPSILILNWTPTADHSPFYYAKAQGWYEKAGIDLTIEVGKGSGVSSLKVGSGGSPFGIADLATMLVAKSKGADVVALMSIYANTGQTFYWLKSYGVNGPKDFPNHKIGNPPGDASRVMWPAFAKAAGIAPDSVNFVNVGPTAKIAALKSHTVDIISDFYNEHDLKVIEFGRRPRLRQLEGHRAQSLRQLADRQRRVSGRRIRSWSRSSSGSARRPTPPASPTSRRASRRCSTRSPVSTRKTSSASGSASSS